MAKVQSLQNLVALQPGLWYRALHHDSILWVELYLGVYR